MLPSTFFIACTCKSLATLAIPRPTSILKTPARKPTHLPHTNLSQYPSVFFFHCYQLESSNWFTSLAASELQRCIEGSPPLPLRTNRGIPAEPALKTASTGSGTDCRQIFNMYKTLKTLVKTIKSQNPVPSGSGVIHTNNPKLGTVMREHIHVPLSDQIYGKVLLPPVERIRIMLHSFQKTSWPRRQILIILYRCIHLNHGRYTGQIALAPYGILGAPRTRYLQPAAYLVIPCNVDLLTCDSHRCIDAPIRHSPSFDPRLGLQNCSHRVPYEVARPITYNNFCVSLSSLLHWDGGTYHPSFHCQQKRNSIKRPKIERITKITFFFHSFVSDSFLLLSLFFHPIFISCIGFSCVSLVDFIAGSHLPPISAGALSFQHLGQRMLELPFGTGLANPCHCWRNICLPLQLHLYTAPTPVLEQLTIAIV